MAAIEQRFSEQVRCIKRLDTVLYNAWNQEIGKLNTTNEEFEAPVTYGRSPSRKIYEFAWEEWLMEQGSTSRSIDSCSRSLVSDIVPMLNQEDINCLNELFAWHIEKEIVHENNFKKYMKKMSKEQLTFRRFVSINEFIEIMWHNRYPDNLNENEQKLWKDAYSFVETKEEEDDRTYIIDQDCEWQNAKAFRTAHNEDAMYEEFVRQVHDSLDYQLGHQIVLNWNLKSNLSENRLMAWQKIRGNMTLRINEEVAKLRSEKRDAQWLCEYATNFAYELLNKEARILIKPGSRSNMVNFVVGAVVDFAEGGLSVIRKNNDSRLPPLENLYYKFGNGTSCLKALESLVQHHHRFDMALLFLNGNYTYPELYCKKKHLDLGFINPRFCRCIGTFCFARDLVSISAKKYALEQDQDGTYRVALSNITDNYKCKNC